MEIKKGVIMAGLHPCMRAVLREGEQIWHALGRPEGVTVTSALDGTHGASSWHYFGLAIDFRTRYFSDGDQAEAWQRLREALPDYDIVMHPTHIHCEVGNQLAKKLGVYW